MTAPISSDHSEYTNIDSQEPLNTDPPKTEVTDQDKSIARGFLYREMFKNWKAKVAIIPSIIQGVIPIAMYFFFGALFSDAAGEYDTPNKLMDQINIKCLLLAIIAVIAGFAKFFESILWIRSGSELSVSMRINLFNNLMKSEVSFFDNNSIGSILSMLSEDAQIVQDTFGITKGTQIMLLAQFLTGIIATFVYSWRLGLVILASVPIIMICLMFFIPTIMKNASLRFKNVSESMTIAEEALASIRTVRSFNMGDHEVSRFSQSTHEMGVYENRNGYIMSFMVTVVLALVWTAVLVNLYLGSTLIGKKENGATFDFGIMFAVFGFTLSSCFSILALQGTLAGEEKAVASGARILKMTNYVSSMSFEGGDEIDNFTGEIEFRNVSFKYPTRDVFVLRNASFVIKSGQVGALVGHSGSGKSTCVQLLERFYDVTEGVILLDGKDIRSLDPRWLHRKIALVSQEPTLFHGTIRDNILYGVDPGTGQEEIEAAAVTANAMKFINKFALGFDEDVGEKGSKLSGGQRQRIAIARAVIKNPTILITDEATSALDSDSEKKVQVALDTVMKGRTAVIVAHRLTTIQNADIIYVFESGEIKECGTHDDLISKAGFYFNLVRRQLTDIEQITMQTADVEEESTNDSTQHVTSSTSRHSTDFSASDES